MIAATDTNITGMVEALCHIDRVQARKILAKAIEGLSPDEAKPLIEKILVEALEELGRLWETGSVAISQIYMGGIITEALIQHYFKDEAPAPGVQEPQIGIVVLEDQHTLGKKLVSLMVKAQGYALIDLGQGLTAQEIAGKVEQHQIKILLVSCLMYPAALQVKKLKALVGDTVQVIVGGAPFRLDPELWKIVGADAYGANAGDALRIIREVMENG